MNCIKKDIIQKYIDGEANPDEVQLVEAHSHQCPICAKDVEESKRVASEMKSLLNKLVDGPVEVPTFVMPKHTSKKLVISGRNALYGLAAACIILFFVVITHKSEPKIDQEIRLVNNYDWDVDANRPITDQKLKVNIIDPEGNVTEYFID
jgi:hypothetical protein